MNFARFMSSPAGRLLRILAGIVIIFVGLYAIKNAWSYVISVIGLVPLVAGVANVCLLAPLFGGPLKASELVNKS